jgi:hypothetical protein
MITLKRVFFSSEKEEFCFFSEEKEPKRLYFWCTLIKQREA